MAKKTASPKTKDAEKTQEPVKETKTKKTTTVKETVVETPVVETPVKETVEEVQNEKQEEKQEENPVTNYVNKFSSFVEKLGQINKELKELGVQGKTLEKEFNNIVKILSKNRGKATRSTESRPLSGFAMPTYLSDELYEFLGIEKGTKVPRKEVTKMINQYILKNSLRDENDKRNILPNDELHTIFKSDSTHKISYFNLQSYMKHHFIRELKTVV
jgi:chromatin remodeling complex protein RSC6